LFIKFDELLFLKLELELAMTSFFLIVFGFVFERGEEIKDELLLKSRGFFALLEEAELEVEGTEGLDDFFEGLDDFFVLLLRFGIIY